MTNSILGHRSNATPMNWRRSAKLVLRALRERGLADIAVLVLIGSQARNATTWRSDVDFLVLLDGPPVPRPRLPYGLHVRIENKQAFLERLSEGDDYAWAAAKFGKVLWDETGFWNEVQENLEIARWPDPASNLTHARRALTVGDGLLAMGDLDAATEEYLSGASQIARSVLLRIETFPLARAELSRQLRDAGHVQLAEHLEELIEGACDAQALGDIGAKLWEVLRAEQASASP